MQHSRSGSRSDGINRRQTTDSSAGDSFVESLRRRRKDRQANHSADDGEPSWSPDGSNLRNLTNHPAMDWFPCWSPDGRHIAFSSDRADEDNHNRIYVMGSDGSNLRCLTRTAFGGYPCWSPDGRHIIFQVEHRDSIYNINRYVGVYVIGSDGSNLRCLTRTAFGGYPRWSPDGRHIAFIQGDQDDSGIYVMGSDGSNPRRLVAGKVHFDSSLCWSPDGRHIAFIQDQDGQDDSEIYVMGSDGSNPRRLATLPGVCRNFWFSDSCLWSPDGRHIAFDCVQYDGNREIYAIELR